MDSVPPWGLGLEYSSRDLDKPDSALEKRCTELAQHERVQAELQRVQSNRAQFDPVQSNRTQFDSVQSIRTQSNQVQSNRTQFDQVQSDRSQLHSQSMDSNPLGSNPTDSNPMALDQISFNRDGLNAMPSNPVQSNARDSNQMPSSGLSAARLNLDPASTSPFDQLDPLRTRSISGLSPRDPSSKSQNTDDLTSVVRQITNLNRHVATLESKLVTRIEVCESDVNMASNQAWNWWLNITRFQGISQMSS